jgi:prophage antirepressor-like protein
MQELFTFTPFASSGDGFNLSATVKDGEPWFIAADVCRSLGLDRSAVRRLDDDEKGVRTMHTPGGPQSVGVINESGLYSLIFSSRKESAKRFKKWVTNIVLPNLRKHGGYINGQEALSPEAQAEILPQLHNVVSIARERAQEERDARHGAFQVMKSFSGRKRVRRPPTNR